MTPSRLTALDELRMACIALSESVRRVMDLEQSTLGDAKPGPRIATVVNVRNEGTDLTRREKEIADLVATGNSNKDISAQLFISEQTTKNHLQSIYRKLSVRNRLECALKVVAGGVK